MSAVDTLRVALFGSPSNPNHEPSRDGVLAAFTELYDQLQLVDASVAAGFQIYDTKANMDLDTGQPDGTRAYVWDDGTAANNTLYISDGGVWSEDTAFLELISGEDGLMSAATPAEVDAGTADDVAVTPEALAESALIQTLKTLGVTNADGVYVRGLTDYPGSGTASTYGTDVINVDSTALPEAYEMVLIRGDFVNNGPLHIFAYDRDGSDMTVLNKKTIMVESGDQTVLVPFSGPAGSYIGWAGRQVLKNYAAGGSSITAYSGGTLGSPDFTAASTTTRRNKIAIEAFTGKSSAQSLAEEIGNIGVVGKLITIGANDQGSPETGPSGSQWRVINHQFPYGGWIVSVDVTMDEAGSITAYGYEYDGATMTPVTQKTLLGLSSGENLAVPVGLEIPPEGYAGVFTGGIVSEEGLNWLEGGYIGSSSSFAASLIMNADMLSLKWHVIEFEQGTLERWREIIGGVTASASSIAPSAARPSRIDPALLADAMLFVPGMGQSLWIGSPSGNKYNTRQEYGGLSFNGHNYTDVSSTPPVAATPENLADTPAGGRDAPLMGVNAYMRQRIMGEGGPSNANGETPIIVGHAGHGNTPSSEYVKGAAGTAYGTGGWYQMLMDQLTATVAFADGADLIVTNPIYDQGQNDAFEATSETVDTLRDDRTDVLVQIAADLNADFQNVLSDTTTRYMCMLQLCSHVRRSGNPVLAAGWEVAMGDLAAMDVPGSLVSVVGPEYPLAADDGFEDNQHTGPRAGDWRGAFLARGVLTGRKYEPLRVVDSYISGNNIVLVYSRDGLVLDVDTIPLQPNYGFRVYDGSSVEQTSFNVSVENNKILIDCGTDPTGFSVTYGDLNAVGLGNYTGGAGNVRDSAGDTDVYKGRRMDNWALLQEIGPLA